MNGNDQLEYIEGLQEDECVEEEEENEDETWSDVSNED